MMRPHASIRNKSSHRVTNARWRHQEDFGVDGRHSTWAEPSFVLYAPMFMHTGAHTHTHTRDAHGPTHCSCDPHAVGSPEPWQERGRKRG